MNTTQQVESILKHVPSARNSDTTLLITFMQKAGMELSDRQIERFRQMPSTETIRRIRQKLQEQGKYPATEAVNEARYNKFKNMKQNIKYESPERLLEAQGYVILPPGV